jgi:hypothetical protein
VTRADMNNANICEVVDRIFKLAKIAVDERLAAIVWATPGRRS